MDVYVLTKMVEREADDYIPTGVFTKGVFSSLEKAQQAVGEDVTWRRVELEYKDLGHYPPANFGVIDSEDSPIWVTYEKKVVEGDCLYYWYSIALMPLDTLQSLLQE